MNRIISLFVFSLVLQAKIFSQQYTLQQCIDSALANNIPVKQSALLVDIAHVNWNQARSNQLPNLNANVSHGINQGRSIDPFTNTYVNNSINYADYSVGSNVVVFNGMNLKNAVKQNAYGYEASRMELQQAKDNLILNVILDYLQVLNTQDQLASATQQVDVSKGQLQRLEILDKQGAIVPSQVSDVKGQLMDNELTVADLRSQLETAKLNLAQLMNVPYSSSMQLQKIDVDETTYNRSSSEVYQNALQQFAQVKAVELRRISSEYALKSAKGQRYPTLSLGGNVETTYSSVAQDATGKKISYNSQLGNNIFSGLNVGIQIPIFNGNLVRNRIKLADIAVKNNELIEENTKVQLRQEVEQAYVNMTNSYDRYKILLEQVEAYQQSFKAAEARFNAGVGTSVDFLIAKQNLDRSNINLIIAKYDFVLRKKILDYYNGKP